MDSSNFLQPQLGAKSTVLLSKINKKFTKYFTEFIGEGLQKGELCVAILTPRHRRMLNRALQDRGIDIGAAIKAEQYITVNVRSIIGAFYFGRELDEDAYCQTLERIATLAAWEGQGVRAFGEIVGLKWPRLRFYIPQNDPVSRT